MKRETGERLVIIGAGGHGKVVADIVLNSGSFRLIGFLDDDPATWNRQVFGLPVLGGTGLLADLRAEGVSWCLVAVGDNRARLALAKRAETLGFGFPVAVHPRATVAATAFLGAGTVVAAGAVINPDAALGSHVIVNTGAVVEHDNRLGDGVHVSPGAALSGGVVVGEGSHIGTGARVIPGVRIGRHCTVGAGAVVIGDLPDGVVAVGVPARVIKRREPLPVAGEEGPVVVPLSRPDIGPEEERLVLQVLRSGQLSLGPMVPEFERRVAEYVGAKHAVAVSSGTAGLHLCVRALGLGPGDEVITTPFSFVASANCLLFEGVRPVFVDIDPVTWNIDPERIEAAITPRTRAILPVHVFGQTCDMDAILDIARRHGLEVIEDACEALGGTYRGRHAGTFGRAGVFAFYPNKQITTGEGGMIVTDDPDLARACRSMRNQGRGEQGAWLEHERLGYNYRMDEMSAALGVAQMARLEEILAARARVASHYDALLAEIPEVRPIRPRPEVGMSWFVYVVLLPPGTDRERVMASLARAGVQSRPYFSPIHLQPFYRDRFGHRPGDFPVCEDVARRTLALPFHTRLGAGEAELVVASLKEALRVADAEPSRLPVKGPTPLVDKN